MSITARYLVQTRHNFIQYNLDYSSQIAAPTCHKAVNVLTSVRLPDVGKRLLGKQKPAVIAIRSFCAFFTLLRTLRAAHAGFGLRI
jgi:hypothetical protein